MGQTIGQTSSMKSFSLILIWFFIESCSCQVTTCGIGFLGPSCEIQKPNLAQGKPTQQSTMSHGGVSSRAVDGDRNNNYGDGSCTHTSQHAAPDRDWWFVDLEEQHSVGYVRITTRDGYNSPMYDYSIKVGNDDPSVEANRNNAQVCVNILTQAERPSAGQPVDFVCDPPLTGRYVITELNQVHDGWWFNFCEIEVYQGNDCEAEASAFCFNGARCIELGGITCECKGQNYGQNCRYDEHSMDDYLCVREGYTVDGTVVEIKNNIRKTECASKLLNGTEAAVYNTATKSCTLVSSPASSVSSENYVLYWKNYKHRAPEFTNCTQLP